MLRRADPEDPDPIPSTSHDTNQTIPYVRLLDEIVGRHVRNGHVLYEVLPASRFGIGAPLLEQPAHMAASLIAAYEFERPPRGPSEFPVPGAIMAPVREVRWAGQFDSEPYFLLGYANGVQRLVDLSWATAHLREVFHESVALERRLGTRSESSIETIVAWSPFDEVPEDPILARPKPIARRNSNCLSCLRAQMGYDSPEQLDPSQVPPNVVEFLRLTPAGSTLLHLLFPERPHAMEVGQQQPPQDDRMEAQQQPALPQRPNGRSPAGRRPPPPRALIQQQYLRQKSRRARGAVDGDGPLPKRFADADR